MTICTNRPLQIPAGTLDKREDESCSLIFFQGALLGSRHLKRLSGFYDEHASDEIWAVNKYTARGHSAMLKHKIMQPTS